MFQAAIIIPHYNDVERLNRCLTALYPQLTPETELVVVDNCSSQSLNAMRIAFPSLRVIVEPRKGAAHARNRGVAETTAGRLFFLDADCVPAEDWLTRAFELADQGDVVGGNVMVFDETPPPRNGAEAYETVFGFQNKNYIEKKNFSVTANMLTRRDVFEITGPFDQSLSEDIDWCRRAVKLGFTLVYAEVLRIGHPSRSDWHALCKKWRRLTHELFGVNGTSPAGRAKWALKALAMPVITIIDIYRVFCHPALQSGHERRAAFVVLVRLRSLRMAWMMQQVIYGHVLGR